MKVTGEKMIEKNVVVLGAGIAGLSYAYNHTDEDVIIYEQNSYYGGLCHSFKVKDCTFDSAVHLSFTEDMRVREIFDKSDYILHKPVSYNFYYGKWIKHPVINNIAPMENDFKTKCIVDFFERDKDLIINNYSDYLLKAYGKSFKEKFYDVYTKKYWTVESQDLSTGWIGKRLPKVNNADIVRGSYEIMPRNDYYAREMRYPKGGNGFETFLNPLIENVNVQYNWKAVEIDLGRKIILFDNGEYVHYQKLVSSVPLPELIEMTRNCPEIIREQKEQLMYTKISLVSVGVRKSYLMPYLWYYIYDEDIMAARVNCPGIKCSDNVPAGMSSMQFEIYHTKNERVDKDKIIQNTLYAIQKMNLCKDEDIAFIDYRLLPYGNVIYQLHMEKYRDRVIQYYEKQGIKLIGRFGRWEYFWSDQSFCSAI